MADDQDLFGSDDSDGFPEQPKAGTPDRLGSHARASTLRDAFGSEDDDDDEAGVDRRRAYHEDDMPPLDIEAPLTDLPGSEHIRLAKLSNVLGIETKPFEPATFERTADVEVWTDDRGFTRVRMRNQNTIRWREKVLPDGTTQKQSNARFVRWSDGSLQLFVGDEAWDVTELDMAQDNNYLFIKHQSVLQGQGLFPKKLAFRPASLNSKAHRRLTSEVDRRHNKTFKVRSVATVADPAREKAEREKAEEMRIRDKEKLERQQDRAMRRYPAMPTSRPREHAALTSQYLEALPEDQMEGEMDYAATGRVRADLLRTSQADEQAEMEAERRLAMAKRDRPRATPKRTKRRQDESEEEDEDEAAEDSDEMEGFIDEEGEDEEADEDLGKKKLRSAARSKRGIVLSDDDD